MALASTLDLEIAPSSSSDEAVPDRARLSLDPATVRSAGISGGWWPRSRDALTELPGLIAELNKLIGRVRRIALQVDAFDNIPHLLSADGRKVHVAWFRHMNPHTAFLTMAGQADLILLVIPPEAGPVAAAEALRLAASGRRAQQPETILAAGIAAESDLLSNPMG